eukprot:5352543-Heterocapsa_arctica.AAC.1
MLLVSRDGATDGALVRVIEGGDNMFLLPVHSDHCHVDNFVTHCELIACTSSRYLEPDCLGVARVHEYTFLPHSLDCTVQGGTYGYVFPWGFRIQKAI